MTKKEMFVKIRNAVSNDNEMVDFLNKEIALLDKRASAPKKPTAKQLENEKFKTLILEYLIESDTTLTRQDIQEAIPEISNLNWQRVTALLSALVNENKIARSYVKKTPYFSAIGTV